MEMRHQFFSLRAASLLFAVIGCGVIASYAAGQLLPLWISAFIFFLSFTVLFAFLIGKTVGPISFLVYGFFALPFVHLIPYLFFNWDYQPLSPGSRVGELTIWGLATNPYMFDLDTIKLTAELGAAGVSGLLAGMFARYASPERLNDGFGRDASMKTLNIVWFYGILAIALVASKLASPARTIFEAEYTGAGTSSESLHFGSLGLISYSLLILCLVDTIFDSHRRTGIWKLSALVCTILYIVIWLQFARGDRESIPMVISCTILFWKWGAPHFADTRSKIVALRVLAAGFVMVVVAAGFVLQTLRQNLAGRSLSDVVVIAQQSYADPNPVGTKLSISPAPPPSATAQQPTGRGVLFDRVDRIIPKGTWSAVMLTPLSVAGDSLRGLLPLKLGRTYLDFILSIPPGFVAARVGYDRPIDADHGPAHEMRYGQGGTHAVVVPFMNFRIIGVVLILAAWGWLFAAIERRTSNFDPPWAVQKLTAYGMTCAIIPQWMWYGEKILITGFFIWLAVSALYLFAAKGRGIVERSVARKNI